jgi:hypothetical protein
VLRKLCCPWIDWSCLSDSVVGLATSVEVLLVRATADLSEAEGAEVFGALYFLRF